MKGQSSGHIDGGADDVLLVQIPDRPETLLAGDADGQPDALGSRLVHDLLGRIQSLGGLWQSQKTPVRAGPHHAHLQALVGRGLFGGFEQHLLHRGKLVGCRVRVEAEAAEDDVEGIGQGLCRPCDLVVSHSSFPSTMIADLQMMIWSARLLSLNRRQFDPG